jgi:hypothetical protein
VWDNCGMILLTILHFLFFIGFSDELNNGVGRTPQMGKIYCLYGNIKFFYDVNEHESILDIFLLQDGIVGIIMVVASVKQ